MDSASRVQILDETANVSLCANPLRDWELERERKRKKTLIVLFFSPLNK